MEEVEAVVRRVPQLEPFQDLLEGASTVTALNELVDRLLPFAMASRSRVDSDELVERSRPILPHGAVRSELDTFKAATITETKKPVSRGVRLAAQSLSSKK